MVINSIPDPVQLTRHATGLVLATYVASHVNIQTS
uniref:Uncharacterized protein n=1 Tax=Anguilla anguilla TaxID=7936 RepID=A0A0E9TNU6_ANGAN